MNEDMSDEELANIVHLPLGELLNMASIVADLQTTDEAAEEVYALCDLVAAYYGIEQMRATVEEHEDGSYTTRLEPVQSHIQTKTPSTIPGHIRTRGKPKYRVSDDPKKPQDEV